MDPQNPSDGSPHESEGPPGGDQTSQPSPSGEPTAGGGESAGGAAAAGGGASSGGAAAAGGGTSSGGKQGLSTGAKVAIGCGGVVVLGLVVVAAGVIIVGSWFTERAGDFVEQAEQQVVAQETLERVQEEHPFERPPDGVVREDQARTFFAVTDELWAEMGPWAEELQTLAERVDAEDEPSFSDMAAGLQGAGRFMEGRAIFARVLEDHGMAPAEYVWTGFSLARAHDELDYDEDQRIVPEENLTLAQAFDSEIRALVDPPEDERVARGVLLTSAMVWGSTGDGMIHAMGLDTLYADPVH